MLTDPTPNQEMNTNFIQHCMAMSVGTDLQPKHHLLSHAVSDCLEHGNPSMWSTWTDEGLNRSLKA
eukprot:3794691-Alexandrium_andersonii.AAC.1